MKILITGASSGLGKALAETYADGDNHLFLLGRDKKNLSEVKKNCEDKGAKVEVKIIDVCERGEMQKYITSICQKTGLDLVIANAGISGGTAGGPENDEQIYKIFDTNLMGMLNTIQPVLPYLKEKRKGQILIISSLGGYVALPSCPAYSASKAAVRFYGNALADSVAEYNIDIRVVSPGYIKTPLTDKNNFWMPFLMEADEAARIIQIKAENSANPNIAFPGPFYFCTWFIGILWRRLSRYLLRQLPKK